MKKFLFILALLGLFTFGTPNVSEAAPVPVPDCYTIIITCPDGSQHGVIVCSWDQLEDWYEIFCGLPTD